MVQLNIDNVVDKSFLVLLVVIGALALNYVLGNAVVQIISALVAPF